MDGSTTAKRWHRSGVHFPRHERDTLRRYPADGVLNVHWPVDNDGAIVVEIPQDLHWDDALNYPFLAACIALARVRGYSEVLFDHDGPREPVLPACTADPAQVEAAQRRLWIVREVALSLKAGSKISYAKLVNEITETVHEPRFLYVQPGTYHLVPLRLSSGPDLSAAAEHFDRTRRSEHDPDAYVLDLDTMATYVPSDSGWRQVTDRIGLWLVCPMCGNHVVATATTIRAIQPGTWAQRDSARVFEPAGESVVQRDSEAADQERPCACVECKWIGTPDELVPAYEWRPPTSRV